MPQSKAPHLPSAVSNKPVATKPKSSKSVGKGKGKPKGQAKPKPSDSKPETDNEDAETTGDEASRLPKSETDKFEAAGFLVYQGSGTQGDEPIDPSQPFPEIFSAVVKFTMPIAVTGDQIPRRVRTDIRNITKKQRRGLNVLMEGLKCDGCELESGQPVNNHVNALRFMLEKIAEAAGE